MQDEMYMARALKLAARGTALRAGSAEGVPVQLGALPYSLPTDDASE